MFRSVFKSGIRAIYNVSDSSTFASDFWEIYPAKHKQSGNVVSVFIFNKTQFENLVNRLCSQSPNTKNPKLIISECYELIRYGVSQLAKLRHPQILTVIENLEETKLKFLFVSEPVVGNIQTINFEKDNATEIQKGILEVAKGLQFLHNVCDMVHLNIQPTAVLINSMGDWKISGFYFLQSLQAMSPNERENFIIMNSSSVVPFANLNLNFVAPELILDSGGLRLSPANDVWSLGQIIFYLFNKGDCLISCFDSSSVSDYKQAFRKFEQKFYNHQVSDLQYVFKDIPKDLWQTLMGVLARYPNDRLSVDRFIESDYFSGSLIKTMWFVDEFSTKALEDKLIFLEGFLNHENIIHELPSSFKNNKFLPLMITSITNELTTNKQVDSNLNILICDLLRVALSLGAELSRLSFQDRIFDALLTEKKSKKAEHSPLHALINYSVKARLVIIENASLLKAKLNSRDLASVYKALSISCLTFVPSAVDQQSDQIALQDLYLKNLDLTIDDLEFPYIKSELIPLICQVFKTTTIMSTKLQTIETFRMLVTRNIVDQSTITESILPVFENLKSRDKRIVEGAIDYFADQIVSGIVTNMDILVEKLLSQCLRLAFGCDNCNRNDFEKFMSKIRMIEDKLVATRVGLLPSSTGDDNQSKNVNTFESLINLSQISASPIIEAAPKLQVMLPIKKSFDPTHHTRGRGIQNPLRTQAQAGNEGRKISQLSHHATPSRALSLHQQAKPSIKANINLMLSNPSDQLENQVNNSMMTTSSNRKSPPGFSNSTLLPSVSSQMAWKSSVDDEPSLI